MDFIYSNAHYIGLLRKDLCFDLLGHLKFFRKLTSYYFSTYTYNSGYFTKFKYMLIIKQNFYINYSEIHKIA